MSRKPGHLHRACAEGNRKMTRRLILEKHYPKEERFGVHLETPLHVAAKTSGKHSLDIVKFLLENECNVESRDNFGRTPLLLACQSDNREVVQYLIESDACMQAVDKSNESVLHYAVKSTSVEMVRLLIVRGADVNHKDENERTPLHLACIRGFTAMVELMVGSGADMYAKDKW
eukprot:CAMPEP_0113939220 /NCGR_PEP_ID=MMETSP1339-20121228/5569_1 /TAXON_ID=94617 /ORGANISM="Fibrocapsa japonica" /LENGTH=173 /DNA_ID=CAMNT_0000942657 /DNA_START=150 /DNA_END=668 /DNA_ORIENTATION=- /assembly_acc=CAM_ASM_000762